MIVTVSQQSQDSHRHTHHYDELHPNALIDHKQQVVVATVVEK